MNTLETIALAKAVAPDVYRQLSEEVVEGTYVIDCKIHIRGTVKKGKPFEQAVAAAIDPWTLLYRALSKLNGTTVDSLVEEALTATDEEATEIKEQAKRAVARLVAAQKRTMPGRITAQMTWEVVS